jgi:hypothetical protein
MFCVIYFLRNSPNLLSLRKEVGNTHSTVRCLFYARDVFFPKNSETTRTEICEKGQG